MVFNLDKLKQERLKDKDRWEKLDEKVCQVCGTVGDDRRTLFIDCFYSLKEVSPLFIDLFETAYKDRGYGLKICKGCRAILLQLLAGWIEKKGRLIDKHLDDDGILGYSKEEFEKMTENE